MKCHLHSLDLRQSERAEIPQARAVRGFARDCGKATARRSLTLHGWQQHHKTGRRDRASVRRAIPPTGPAKAKPPAKAAAIAVIVAARFCGR